MTTLIIITGPWPSADNIVLPDIPHVPKKGDEFILSANCYKKQAEIIECIENTTGNKCRVVSVSHRLLKHLQEITIHLHCGRAWDENLHE